MPRRAPISPDFIAPMRPALVSVPPIGPGWMHEVKHDGWRVIARKRPGELALWSRPGKDWVEQFTRIAGALRRLPAESFVLDGEAVLLEDNGRNDFLGIRGKMEDAVLMAFDLLEFDGVDLRGKLIEARRAVLAELVAEERRGLLFSRSLDEDGVTVFRHACALGLEGIVSKRRGSKYQSGLSGDWRKCRCEGYLRG